MNSFVTAIDSLDFAATLAALGFPLASRENVFEQDFSSSRHATQATCIWRFHPVSPTGLTIETVQKTWAAALVMNPKVPGDAVSTARRAMQNLRALRSSGNSCAPIFQVRLPATVRLFNFRPSGAPSSMVPSYATHISALAECSDVESAVIAAAGCHLASVQVFAGRARAVFRPSENGIDPLHLRDCLRSPQWVEDPSNFAPAAVAMAAIRNRRELMAGSSSGEDLIRLMRGDSVAVIRKNASDEILRKAAAHLNI